MYKIAWKGSPWPREVGKAFRAVRIDRVEEGAIVTVVSTTNAKVPPAAVGPWIWVTAAKLGDDLALAAARAGAYDAISLDDRDAPRRLVARIAELAAPAPAIDPGELVARSPAARRYLEDIAHAARTSMPVLLTGETGTGKDVAARLLHARSSRAARRFVAINCAAIPDDLMEAELFGYVRGAFSGAVADYDGQLAAAAGGTVFLDEIDDTPPTLQAKLLRVLDDKTVSRLGENEWHKVDFRIVAATNRDLHTLVASGAFAGDLYQRLAIVQIDAPPLRERLDDLPALVAHFIARFFAEEERRVTVTQVAPAALRALAAYAWPGNVRELRNVVYQALVGKRAGDTLLAADLPRRLLAPAAAPVGVDAASIARAIDAGTFDLRRLVEDVERTALRLALDRAGGRPAIAARHLGTVGRGASAYPAGTVRSMIRRLGIAGARD